jgi:hypothetical protein
MPKSIEDLDAHRLAHMNRLVDQLVVQRGHDLSQDLAPDRRLELTSDPLQQFSQVSPPSPSLGF